MAKSAELSRPARVLLGEAARYLQRPPSPGFSRLTRHARQRNDEPGSTTTRQYGRCVHEVDVRQELSQGDLDALVRLAAAASRAGGHRALGESRWLELAGGGDGFAGIVATESRSGEMVGYAQLSGGSGAWVAEYVVHPSLRGDPSLRSELLSAAVGEVSRRGGGRLRLFVFKPSPMDDAAAAAYGLATSRNICQMRRLLPVESARSSIETRAFRPGRDEAAWVEANNRAFAGHPEQGSWTREDLEARESQEWFDPEGFLLLESEGRLAGFCWTKVSKDYDGGGLVGEIYVIGVDPDFQHRGLGRQLVLAGLEHMSAGGVPKAMLYVDEENRPARALYRGLGFSDDHVDRVYSAVIA